MKKIIILIAIVMVASFAFFKCATFGACSEGFRVGELNKFSEKGVVFPTWEGEILLGGLGGSSMANSFPFSVVNQNVIDTLNVNGGMKVTLYYTEYYGVSFMDGNTSYLIDSVLVHR
jgi:hypothetical protein